jgi:hypothetical protein
MNRHDARLSPTAAQLSLPSVLPADGRDHANRPSDFSEIFDPSPHISQKRKMQEIEPFLSCSDCGWPACRSLSIHFLVLQEPFVLFEEPISVKTDPIEAVLRADWCEGAFHEK